MKSDKLNRTQKTTLGYNAKLILKLIERRKNSGFENPRRFFLRAGWCIRAFELLADNPENIVIKSGLVTYTLLK